MKNIVSIAQSQIGQIKKGGVPLIYRKIRTALRMAADIVLVPLALPIALLIRLLKPVKLIRFGRLPSERIGHFAANIESYLCHKDLFEDKKTSLDIFYYERVVCNKQLAKMWSRVLHIWPAVRWIDMANRLIPGWEEQEFVVKKYNSRDAAGLFNRTSPHLYFTKKEQKAGDRQLRKLGLCEDDSFVCFASRDSAYLEKIYPCRDWRYHDHRNASIANYIPAALAMVERGYYAVRMGAIVEEAIGSDNPRIIDYANNGRTEFLDIYISSKCKFFITSSIGLLAVPKIFRRPIAFVNYIPIGYLHTGGKSDLTIFKKLWLKKEKKFLTFREMYEFGIEREGKGEKYKEYGIEIMENTPEEITALAIEMDERLKGTWRPQEKDEVLQRRFWEVFKPLDENQIMVSRIGAEYLRQNEWLLE